MARSFCFDFRVINSNILGVRKFRTFVILLYEPHHDKNCLQGFQHGAVQPQKDA